ncbi:hypothetical protein [Nonomuraea gerenzanensis]|uniref:Uncharacterized protein n=1 Tax=Nonomuraea gerenzanensis TaxID=93944 RepID=A0A1M4EBU6_9ACTN|nr:hypothetical protein [Nonomuraea gerenzanensis]UBU18436.1 hypothetical protein LCN96_26465 [Nonomuraea gerenzanensis]SBO96270.1 hypothetical protein BN4615_P5786 [Nonomuraea gerenzanensis]
MPGVTLVRLAGALNAVPLQVRLTQARRRPDEPLVLDLSQLIFHGGWALSVLIALQAPRLLFTT